MSAESMFLDRPFSFWIELKRRTDEKLPLDYAALLTEIYRLRGRVSFYESRIDQLVAFKSQPH